MAKAKAPARGMVYLVGAGPGDVGLLTLRGAEVLGQAQVVVYDALINPELLRLVPAGAEIVFGGKRSSDHAMPQDELNRLLVQHAEAGKTVVRLKGGDPYIFGRGGEEAQELADAGVPFEVVPGVSAISAVPNYAGIPITHRDHCSSFTVITGHENPEKGGDSVDWASVAATQGTTIVLMGVKRIREIAAELVRHGRSAKTPVALVHWGTTSRQKTLTGTLANIADRVVETGFTAPAVIVIGEVVNLRAPLNWFESRPLFGKRVVVTRTREQAGQLARRLAALSADVLEIPTIKILPTDRPTDVADVLLELNSYDWLIFTSPNGVTMFFEYFFKAFEDLRDIGGVKIAAVGPATAAKLRELHLKVDLMPEEYVAPKIAGALAKYESIDNLKLLLLRAEVANRELPEALEALGGIVDDIACYRTVPETEDPHGVAARMLESGADWITFTSSSTVENFHARFPLPALREKFPGLKLASIGPETSKTIAALGLQPDVEAKPHTIDGLVAAMIKAETGRPARKKA